MQKQVITIMNRAIALFVPDQYPLLFYSKIAQIGNSIEAKMVNSFLKYIMIKEMLCWHFLTKWDIMQNYRQDLCMVKTEWLGLV